MSTNYQPLFVNFLNDLETILAEWRAFLGTLGNARILTASKTQVMGGHDVQILASVTPADGESIYQPPKCQAFKNATPVSQEYGMQLLPIPGSNLWTVTIPGVTPEPNAVKLTATFINATFNITTVTDVKPL